MFYKIVYICVFVGAFQSVGGAAQSSGCRDDGGIAGLVHCRLCTVHTIHTNTRRIETMMEHTNAEQNVYLFICFLSFINFFLLFSDLKKKKKKCSFNIMELYR